MNAIKAKWLALGLGLLVSTAAWAGPSDAWITTKAQLALLTTDGVAVTAVNVDTVNGYVTLHGKVKSDAEKAKAETAVKSIDGVKGVSNLLQVVPDAFRETVKVSDQAIKEKVEAALKAEGFADVKVASVNNGVALLSGKTQTLADKLRAVQCAWKVQGVQRVASEIETGEK